jgi:hypothetical protein
VAYGVYDQITRKGGLKGISPILIFYLIGIIGVLLLQYLYYGSIFPNAYYLKMTGVLLYERMSVGVRVFIKYAIGDFLLPLIIIIGGLLFIPDLREKRNVLLLSLFLMQIWIYHIYWRRLR